MGILLLVIGLTGAAAPAAEDPKKPGETADSSRLEALWADLASTDEGTAARAVLALAVTPREALPLLQKRLRGVRVDPKRVAVLLRQLDSDGFAEREAAFEELEYLGRFIQKDLQKVLEGKPTLEVKTRVQRLLALIPEAQPAPQAPEIAPGSSVSVSNNNGQVTILVNGKPLDLTPRVLPAPPGPSKQQVRAVRAVALLEHIGTPEAQQILRTLADGEDEALPTRAATAALKRLKK
jgi:hypothetical protein